MIQLATVLSGNSILFAGIMYVRIVLTALILNAAFTIAGIIPEGRKVISDITQM
jgi:hypothetical protein